MTAPDQDTALAAAVALAREVGLDEPRLADRLEREDPRVALAAELGALTSLLPEDPAPRIARAAAELAAWARGGIRLVTIRDAGYPDRLRQVHDRPALLWMAGDEMLVGASRAIAIVGSRRPSDHGLATAASFATAFARAGFAVLSGLAAGIDTAAHRAAMAAGGRTVAVIGTGLEHIYPAENAGLQAELARDHALISAFWPRTGPAPEHFRRRNAVMSGLGLGTVIVEASVRSGTRVQARAALAHGRPVFLRRELLGQRWAAELAQRPGVHVVGSAADVLEIVEAGLDLGPLTAGPASHPPAAPEV
ncbi:MAG TPA: DNA-processing protein DprA [Solirubrobacteraceae bacterium]|nr:DNA-processing protein DprA [Solirubrobacteraceae bacterium]